MIFKILCFIFLYIVLGVIAGVIAIKFIDIKDSVEIGMYVLFWPAVAIAFCFIGLIYFFNFICKIIGSLLYKIEE